MTLDEFEACLLLDADIDYSDPLAYRANEQLILQGAKKYGLELIRKARQRPIINTNASVSPEYQGGC